MLCWKLIVFCLRILHQSLADGLFFLSPDMSNRNFFPPGYPVLDNDSHAQASSSHHCLVPRGWQGLHPPAAASLPAVLDFPCTHPVLGLLDHGPAVPWHYRYVNIARFK